jgi:predicted nucleotidyltransferase
MATGNSDEIRDVVRKYYETLLNAGFPLEKVVLFGSYAKNKQNTNSDIDVAVVLKKFKSDRFSTRLELMKYSRGFKEVIEPHPFLVSEFEISNPFVLEIMTTGVELYS